MHAKCPHIACALLAFLLPLLLFAPSVPYGHVNLDDITYISDNPLHNAPTFSQGIAAAFSSFHLSMYAPLLWVSYHIDDVFASPAAPYLPYHLHNVLLHAVAALLFYLLLLRLAPGHPLPALLAVLLWALHPLRVESVAWVAERKDVLSATLALLSLLLYARAIRRDAPARFPRPLPWLLSLLAFALALLSKSSVLPLAAALLLFDVYPWRRLPLSLHGLRTRLPALLLEKLPFLLLAFASSRLTLHGHQMTDSLVPVPRSERLLALPLHYAFYLFKTILPLRLSPLYPDLPVHLPIVALSMALLLGLAFLAWRTRHQAPAVALGLLLFALFLFPAAGLVRFAAQSIADRFAYLPALGLSLALLPLLIPAPDTPRLNHCRRLLPLLLLIPFAAMTLHVLPTWTNLDTFVARMVRCFPDAFPALCRGAEFDIYQKGDFASAEARIDRALSRPNVGHDFYRFKAICLAHRGEFDLARQYARQAIELASPFDRAPRHLDDALIAYLAGNRSDAIHSANAGLQALNSQYAYTRPALLAIQRDADLPTPSLLLAAALWQEGFHAEASDALLRLVDAAPADIPLLNNVAWGLATADWSTVPPEKTLALARRLDVLLPDSPPILDTLAAALANAGDYSSATAIAQQALDLVDATPSPPHELLVFRQNLAARRTLYATGNPYRESAFTRLLQASDTP